MPRRKRKGIELDSTSPRQRKQLSVHKHGEGGKSFKGKNKKEISGGGKGETQGSAHLSNKPTAAHNVDGYSGNWRALAKQLGMGQSRKKEQRTTSTEHSQSERTHKEHSGKDLVAMATTSSKRQQLERRKTIKKQTLRKRRKVARGTCVDSMSPGGVGTGVEDSVKVNSRERHFQGNKRGKDTSMAALQSAHVKMDPCTEQVANKHKKSVEKRRGGEEKEEGRLWLRKPEAPSVVSGKKKTGVWHTEPGNLKEEKFESIRKKKTFKRKDIWFDDVDVEMVEGEPVPKKPRLEPSRTSLVTGNDKSVGKCIALDCEMVGTGPTGDFSMLARCSLVNHHGNTLYDKYVAPMDVITDYRTQYSGIRPRDLEGASDFKTVQREVSDLITGRILVGHGLQHDLKALLLSHPKKDIRDTSKYKPFRKLASKGGTPSLKKLALEILGISVQKGEHNSVEDARVAMRLYQLHKREWEEAVKTKVWKRQATISNSKSTQVTRQRDLKQQPSQSKPFNVMLSYSG